MEEYTYNDVVTIKDIMTGEVDEKSLKGKWGWTGDSIKDVLRYANGDFDTRMIEMVDTENLNYDHPFFDGLDYMRYFVPAKNQDADNEDTEDRPLRKGDFVRLRSGRVGVCMANDRLGENEIIDIWFDPRNSACISACNLTRVDGHFEPIDFTDRNTREEYMGMKVEMDADSYGLAGKFECIVTGFHVSEYDAEIGLSVLVLCHGRAFTPEEFLEDCRFLNGVPCGRPVEDKEERP